MLLEFGNGHQKPQKCLHAFHWYFKFLKDFHKKKIGDQLKDKQMLIPALL